MPFSGSKVEAAVVLHPQVVDQNNFTRVLSALGFDRDRAEVRKRLGCSSDEAPHAQAWGASSRLDAAASVSDQP